MLLFCCKPKQTSLNPHVRHTNNLAAICDHSDPSWRSSALGTYRFWRDMGYTDGALVTGTYGNWSLTVRTSRGLYQETGE